VPITASAGAPLARLELQIAYQTLFRRLPELRPAQSDPAARRWKADMGIVGLLELRICSSGCHRNDTVALHPLLLKSPVIRSRATLQ
jgi:hypothetical protein